MRDTIAAIATGPARSAVGIIRVSGPGAIAAVQGVFRTKSGRGLAECPGRLVLGTLLDAAGAPIDQAMAVCAKGPRSYTGEDTAELHCHGSPAVLALALEALFGQGARQAEPGEFTRRAFLNGKLDLMQAEAVADLIDAETAQAARCAGGQLAGVLSRRIQGVYGGLVDVSAHFHAVLDYPDEDIDPFGAETLDRALGTAEEDLSALLATYRRGRLLAGGIPCAIVGRPNAGKSSLLNALLGYERAIVADLPGTTRDTVEERCTFGGALLRLIDTAGIRDTADAVERLGVERSRQALAGAELVLVLADRTRPLTEEDAALLAQAAQGGRQVIFVQTKADLPGEDRPAPVIEGKALPTVCVSSATGAGLEALEAAVSACFPPDEAQDRGEMLTNPRQAQGALRARDSIRAARAALSAGMTPDAVLVDVEDAMDALGQLTGRSLREDVTNRIFQRFCVGK
ncbi:tRNA uridine-5-carboxymethylaminomethyl(34) synthesis GTPase MnmE [Pseudoflavonifractor sp. 524-17]|nr:tRNA uridine-5-carboxymethylaminomethyl(34) synthesis GTPase MnmE [Pseudoflavonifractor sp. 524-17]NCE63562.1 tRNA uridine-5-carboxymethylaminomethyl(34) synthesis GTPase MnmE [Pseudoflavonifractor sp. 524-17]